MLKHQINNHPILKERRQQLRNESPKAERILWMVLKNKQLNGLKFRRQHSIGPFVLDFYCPSLRLALEIDGPSHFVEGAKESDDYRQKYIEQHHIQFLRFTNQEVYENLQGVIQEILNWVDQHGNNHSD